MALPKWTEERTAELMAFIGEVSPVTRELVAEAAEKLETTARSIASKLRKEGFEVETVSAAPHKYTEEEETVLASFVTENSGQYTYAQIAELFAGGKFSAKSIQGKILSMELTEHVKKAEPPVSTKTYSDEEEATFVKMASEGASIEAIADALGREVNSVRGKALSLLRSGTINSIPKQDTVKAPTVDPVEALGDLSNMTVEQIAEALDKTPRGVRTMLTRRGLVAADYDGAAKAAKSAKNAA